MDKQMEFEGFGDVSFKPAELVDELYTIRAERYELQNKVDEIKKRETQIKDVLIEQLQKDEATGVAGKKARVTLRAKEYPRVLDWDAVHQYIKDTGSFELLQKRLLDKAVKDRWDLGEDVPGVESATKMDLGINKV